MDARIVFPEGDDPRVIAAAGSLARDGVVRPILLTQNTPTVADDVVLLNPTEHPNFQQLAKILHKKREHTGMSAAEAEIALAEPINFAAMMLATGLADGCVAGAVHATSDVLRAALRYVGMADGVSIASSTFLMILPDGRTLTYGDCGMVPNPDAAQLAEIAVSSAETHRQLTGDEPVVAMLSFSTKGSARHPDVDKVRSATELAQTAAPHVAIDGELQFDAAWVSAIGDRKAPGSPVTGRANVFIFPNLDAGNISYKITERLGNAQALGPIIQGLAKPMHDLSRGCKAEDIELVAMIAAVQSAENST